MNSKFTIFILLSWLELKTFNEILECRKRWEWDVDLSHFDLTFDATDNNNSTNIPLLTGTV